MSYATKLVALVQKIVSTWSDNIYVPKHMILCNRECALFPLMELLSYEIVKYNKNNKISDMVDHSFLEIPKAAKLVAFVFTRMTRRDVAQLKTNSKKTSAKFGGLLKPKIVHQSSIFIKLKGIPKK